MVTKSFDTVADEYDSHFTNTSLGRSLRESVRARLSNSFKAGDLILELNCGTGEDAIWLAERGIDVVASDASAKMLEIAARKASLRGLDQKIRVRHLDLSYPQGLPEEMKFDGAFSNFGGFNCVGDLRPAARMLGKAVKPGARLIIVIMSRFCAWEMIWHMVRLQPRTAFRRLKQGGTEASLGDRSIHVWYPSLDAVRRVFEPEFKLKYTAGLGVFMPPSYLGKLVAGRPRLLRLLGQLDTATAEKLPFSRVADHLIIELECTEGTADRSGSPAGRDPVQI